MIGLDTNVLVRYIAQDDTVQARIATSLIESLTERQPGFVSVVTVTELVWVLQKCFGSKRAELVTVLRTLASIRTIILENPPVVAKAVHLFSAGPAEFADCLIAQSGTYAGCQYSVTFDRKAAKLPGMRLLSSLHPT